MQLAPPTADQLYSDLNYLLSCIRVRENNFILLLERLRDIEDFDMVRPQELNKFLHEEQNHVEVIQNIVIVYSGSGYTDPKFVELIGRFWNKLLKLIKVSLERLKLLNLVNQRIWDAYTEIIALLTSTLSSSDLRMIRHLELIFRRRYMSVLEMESDNRHKYVNSATEKDLQERRQYRLRDNRRPADESAQPQKMKSLNRELNKKRSEQSISKRFIENNCRRIVKLREKLEEDHYKYLDAKCDMTLFDKKKNREFNAIAMYDQLFSRNIPNHKIITKYIFQASRTKDIRFNQSSHISTRQAATVSIKPKTLLDSRKECLNKSARKMPEKDLNINKQQIKNRKKKKISDDVELENPQLLFSSSRLKRFEQRFIKVRPKTAKLEKQELRELRLNMESSKKRYRKLIKKVSKI